MTIVDLVIIAYFFFSSRRRHTRSDRDWSSDVCSSDLFSYAVRAVYVESCSMFVRGGVYRAVKMSLGGTLAKFSGSALMFDYILTGPISGVAAGRYLA